jgi:hypothetical protein
VPVHDHDGWILQRLPEFRPLAQHAPVAIHRPGQAFEIAAGVEDRLIGVDNCGTTGEGTARDEAIGESESAREFALLLQGVALIALALEGGHEVAGHAPKAAVDLQLLHVGLDEIDRQSPPFPHRKGIVLTEAAHEIAQPQIRYTGEMCGRAAGLSARDAFALQHGDTFAGTFQEERRGQSGNTGADDDHVDALRQFPAIARSPVVSRVP